MAQFETLDEDEWLRHVGNSPPAFAGETLSPIDDTTTYLGVDSGGVGILTSRRSSDGGPWAYLISLASHLRENRSIRGKQARLTLWELLELFDLSNDALFLIRVSDAVYKAKDTPASRFSGRLAIGQSAMLCLLCLYIVSICAYLTRHRWIYHRIPYEDQGLFVPILSLTRIRQAGANADKLDSLFMFERLIWTYQLAMRVLEDVPQVIISTLFLANYKRDGYTFFMIAYSISLLLLTSYRMGTQYPLLRTVTLLFSRRPPVDSPVLEEAAPTTRHFALFVSFYFAAWAICHGVCSILFSHMIWRSVCRALSGVAFVLSLLFAVHWLYLVIYAARVEGASSTAAGGGEDELTLLLFEPRTTTATTSDAARFFGSIELAAKKLEPSSTPPASPS